MRILVTGGTGFVGSHSVRALQEAGHEVRILVRDPERVRPALEPLGAQDVESVVGEMTDPAAVRRALEGCEAVLHAASVYKLSRRHAKEMESVNPRGTEVVLGTAQELGLDPIIHVSSYVALLPPPPNALTTADAPVGQPAGPYSRSKAASEAIARRLQDQGAPVVVTQPGSVWGPHDPHFGESSQIASMILKGRMPVALPGLMAIVDVRDVAAAHVAVMEPGRGHRQFLLVAEDLSFSEMIEVVRRTSGRRLPAAPLPRSLMRRTLGGLRRVPADLEGPWIALQAARHESKASQDLGVQLRSAEESIADTVRWLEGSAK